MAANIPMNTGNAVAMPGAKGIMPSMPAQTTPDTNYPMPSNVQAIAPQLSGGYYNQMAQQMAGPNYYMPRPQLGGGAYGGLGTSVGVGPGTAVNINSNPTGLGNPGTGMPVGSMGQVTGGQGGLTSFNNTGQLATTPSFINNLPSLNLSSLFNPLSMFSSPTNSPGTPNIGTLNNDIAAGQILSNNQNLLMNNSNTLPQGTQFNMPTGPVTAGPVGSNVAYGNNSYTEVGDPGSQYAGQTWGTFPGFNLAVPSFSINRGRK